MTSTGKYNWIFLGLMAKSIINDARLNIAHMLGASSNGEFSDRKIYAQ